MTTPTPKKETTEALQEMYMNGIVKEETLKETLLSTKEETKPKTSNWKYYFLFTLFIVGYIVNFVAMAMLINEVSLEMTTKGVNKNNGLFVSVHAGFGIGFSAVLWPIIDIVYIAYIYFPLQL